MSMPPTSFSHDPVDAIVLPQQKRVPGGLTAVAVIGLLLGILQLLFCAVGIVGLLAGPQLQQSFAPPPNGNQTPQEVKDMQELQQNLNSELEAVLEKYWPINAGLNALGGLIGFVLVFGAVLLLRMRPSGNTVFVCACAAALLAELPVIGVFVAMQMDNMAAVNTVVSEVTKTAPEGPDGEAAKVISTIIVAGFVTLILMTVGWSFLKAVYYVFAMRYCRKPEIIALFEPAQEDPA